MLSVDGSELGSAIALDLGSVAPGRVAKSLEQGFLGVVPHRRHHPGSGVVVASSGVSTHVAAASDDAARLWGFGSEFLFIFFFSFQLMADPDSLLLHCAAS